MVYYVEDDTNIREITLYALTQAGIDAQGFSNDAAFRRACDDRIPDAVFCFNDQLAIGALKAIKKRGYRIPEQIAVMGFSESQSALLTEPQLSSVAQPLDLIGETAANLLLEKIKNPDAPDRTVVLDARINIRESTDVRPQQ